MDLKKKRVNLIKKVCQLCHTDLKDQKAVFTLRITMHVVRGPEAVPVSMYDSILCESCFDTIMEPHLDHIEGAITDIELTDEMKRRMS